MATKLLASRVGRDEDDIVTLYALCGYTTVEQGLVLLEQFYPNRPIAAKVRFLLEGLVASMQSDTD
ncbi:MAG: hypothetical protein ACOYN3_08845 [Acidimicrobiia bacterium]